MSEFRKSGRFDYVAYDSVSQGRQGILKRLFECVEDEVEICCISPRYKALVLTKLEEAYAFAGKAIRDDQITRNGAAPLQEQRGPG